MRVALTMFVLLTVANLGGCARQTEAPPSSGSAPSYDGLYPVENVSISGVWARPDIDLAGYHRILLRGAGIQYRPLHDSAAAAASPDGPAAFPLTEDQKARLEEIFRNAFGQELARSERFRLADAPAPDVLVIRGGLLDVVSRTPPSSLAGSDVYLESVGTATLLIELIDSQSGAVLLRAIDRREVPRSASSGSEAPASSWQEVERLAQEWAERLREELDNLDRRMTID